MFVTDFVGPEINRVCYSFDSRPTVRFGLRYRVTTIPRSEKGKRIRDTAHTTE